MIVACAWCGAVMGYKCPECGEVLHACEFAIYECRNWRVAHRRRFWKQVEMQTSHGICPACAQSALAGRSRVAGCLCRGAAPARAVMATEGESKKTLADVIDAAI